MGSAGLPCPVFGLSSERCLPGAFRVLPLLQEDDQFDLEKTQNSIHSTENLEGGNGSLAVSSPSVSGNLMWLEEPASKTPRERVFNTGEVTWVGGERQTQGKGCRMPGEENIRPGNL